MKTPTQNSQSTKTLLLDCAEQLFLAHGFDGVSIRQITLATGTNVAAINYHFNGKRNLYRAVLARRLKQIADAKVALLSELAQRRPAPELKEILVSYIRSYFDAIIVSPDKKRLVQMIYRELGPDAIAGDLVTSLLVAPIHRIFQKMLLQLCPEIEPKRLSLCISSISGQVLHFVQLQEALREMHTQPSDELFLEEIIQHIAEFSLHGLKEGRPTC
ncbi:MAG: TetR/AcrR family transcriptional regulator [Desulfuromonadales bacterium]|nr:TetR/AcrR family transcriptional regulator [Desulfuromonadales bacterium]